MTDLKQAFRGLLRTPFVSGVAVLSLALGIGANAAIFSVFEQLLLRSMPVVEPERLVNLSAPGPKGGSQSCNQAGDCDVVLSYPMYRDLEREHPGLAGLAGHRAFSANLAQDDRTVDGDGMLVSGSYFPLLGIRPALGRLFQPGDDEVPGEHTVAVLSHRFWRNDLGGDPDVLNRTLTVNGIRLTVVGVAPEGFDGTTLGARPDVFVPLSMRGVMESYFTAFDDRRSYWVYAFGRLEPGTSLEQASAEINQLYSSILNESEVELQSGMTDADMESFRTKKLILEPGQRGQSTVDDESRTPLLLLLGITALVLLIACANIANLLLARGAQRSTEMAVRSSLGAGRYQLLRQLLTESLLLALIGGLGSLLVARGTLVYIGSLVPPEARDFLRLEIEPTVLVFTVLVTLATGLLFGLYPAIHATRTELASTLRGSSGQTGARAAARFRAGLVTAQIALSMTLLICAGLFIRSLANVSRVDLGLETRGVVTFSVSPRLNGYEPERSRILFDRLEEELGAVPGVAGVTAAMVPVLANSSWGSDVSVEGRPWEPGMESTARFNQVGPGYFRTMGIPLVAGREFTAADAGEESSVAIVNETFAREFGLDPRRAVGKLMGQGVGDVELDIQIVGVVEDARYSAVRDEVPPQFFLAHREDATLGFLTFYVRTVGDPAPVLRAIPEVMKRLDPTLPVEELKTLDQQVTENIFLDRLVSLMAATFAALATLLAAIGLYGVLSYTVAQRTREIGLRMALGARAPTIRLMVLRQVGWMLAAGGVIGVAAAFVIGRAAGSLLYEIQGSDPVTFAAAALLLGAVALAAGFIPAARAARVEPMKALRYE